MGSPTNANPTQLFNVDKSSFMNTENRNISSLGLSERGKEKESPLPIPPSGMGSSSPLLASPPRDILFKQELERELRNGRHLDPNFDIKKLRRNISNRLSAQRSRVHKVHYTLHLEKTVKEIRDNIYFVLTPQVERQKQKNNFILRENEFLEKQLEMRATEEKLRELREEALKFEIKRLSELQIGNMEILNSESNLNFNQPLHPYPTIRFYEENMHNLQENYSTQEIGPSGFTFEQSVENGSYMAEEPTVEPNQESTMEEDVDQYLNYEQVDLDAIDFVCC